MLDAQVLIWVAGGAVVACLVVYFVLLSGRRALEAQVSAAQAAQAVAESRLADLTGQHVALQEAQRRLSEERVTLIGDRERLRTSFEAATGELERERTTAAGLRTSLEAANAKASQLDADHRVARQRSDDLSSEAASLQQRLAATEAANHAFTTRVAALGAEVSALQTERNGLNERLAAQEKWFAEQTQAFEQKVVNMTNRLLEEKSQKFTAVNKQEIDAVVGPFREQLKEFRTRVDTIYATETRERGQLHEQIRQLTDLNQTVSEQAQALTRALTVSSKSTGDWGEMILQKILEDSGLREGKEYTLQETVEAQDEALQRPDAIIYLPEDRQLVIDAKVSNKAWTDYCHAVSDEEREEHLAAHLASIRAHIRELSARDYPNSPDLKTVDFVLMFVPVEAALVTALARDEGLYMEAYKKKIVLVTASTLVAVIRLVEGTWAYQKRKESADKIAEAGRKMLEKFTTFAGTFVEVGEAIHKAHGTWEKAQGQLATGKGNVIRMAQKMVDLGVTPAPGKVMPAQLVELAGDDEEGDSETEALPAPETGASTEGDAAS